MSTLINLVVGFVLGFLVATVGVENIMEITGENVHKIQELSNTLTE